ATNDASSAGTTSAGSAGSAARTSTMKAARIPTSSSATRPTSTTRATTGATPTLPAPPRPKLDVRRARTYPLARRASKVAAHEIGGPLEPGLTFAQWLERLPNILAAADLRFAAETIARARLAGRGVALGMGAHPIKVGLSPLIV